MLVLLAEISTGVPDAPSFWFAGWCGTATFERASLAVEKSAEVVLPAGLLIAGKDRTQPSVRTFVLVVVALNAANPFRGLVGNVGR